MRNQISMAKKEVLWSFFECLCKYKSYRLVFKDSKNDEKSFGSKNLGSRLARDHPILFISQQLGFGFKKEWYH